MTDAERDVDSLTSWDADWAGLRVLVLGIGPVGFSVADTLVELGAEVLATSDNEETELIELLRVIGGRHVRSAHETIPDEVISFAPELVVSAGSLYDGETVLGWVRAQGIPIWNDVELAWRIRDRNVATAEWVLVSGSVGNVVTADLATHVLEADGRRVGLAGGHGVPILDIVRYPAGFDIIVVTAWTRQLAEMGATANGTPIPWASVCINSRDDGSADSFPTRESFLDALARVYRNTKSAALYNRDDADTQTMLENAEVTEGCRAIGFWPGPPGPSDFGIVDGILCDRAFLEERATTALEIATLEDIVESGLLESPQGAVYALVASALARSFEVAPAIVREAIRSFRLT